MIVTFLITSLSRTICPRSLPAVLEFVRKFEETNVGLIVSRQFIVLQQMSWSILEVRPQESYSINLIRKVRLKKYHYVQAFRFQITP